MFDKALFLKFLSLDESTIVQDESLEKHDKRYHGGKFDPETMSCGLREDMASRDDVDTENNVSRYLLEVSRGGYGNGYRGYSMSNNAVMAYENGEKPLSKWTKKDIIDAIAKIDPDKAGLVKNVALPVLKAEALRQSSWHHSSSWYNKVDFYSINEGFIENLNDERAKQLENIKVEKEDARVYKGDFDYIEWTGTRTHPKAIKHHLENATIEERGSFYYVTDKDGNVIKKKIGSNGTVATDYNVQERAKAIAREKLDNLRKYTTPAAMKFMGGEKKINDGDMKLIEENPGYAATFFFAKAGLESSREGNYYIKGRKPSRMDYANGLENFLKVGEQRAVLNDLGGYSLETWNGKVWKREPNPKASIDEVSELLFIINKVAKAHGWKGSLLGLPYDTKKQMELYDLKNKVIQKFGQKESTHRVKNGISNLYRIGNNTFHDFMAIQDFFAPEARAIDENGYVMENKDGKVGFYTISGFLTKLPVDEEYFPNRKKEVKALNDKFSSYMSLQEAKDIPRDIDVKEIEKFAPADEYHETNPNADTYDPQWKLNAGIREIEQRLKNAIGEEEK